MKTHLHFYCLSSTNTYLKDLVSKHPAHQLQEFLPPFFAVTADMQEEGRGRQNKKWESEPGKNLLVSLLLYPDMPPSKQFAVCQYVSIAIADLLTNTFSIPDVYIKWPNDIYIGHKKIVGILIEHFIRGESINYSIAGIGMNINQTIFPTFLPNITSLSLETGQEYDPIACMKELIKQMKQTEKLSESCLKTRYEDYLYKKGEFSDFIVPAVSNNPVSLNITGVSETGLLQLLDENNILHCYAFNEIIYCPAIGNLNSEK